MLPYAIGSGMGAIQGINNGFSNYTTANKALSNLIGTRITDAQAQALAGNGFSGL